jgi:hypothetical protein
MFNETIPSVKGDEMSLCHPHFTAQIQGAGETIFDLIADMPNYGRWLRGSEAFGGTTKVSPYPVRLGTTYLDAGPAGQRPGSVTAYDRPNSPFITPCC